MNGQKKMSLSGAKMQNQAQCIRRVEWRVSETEMEREFK